MQFDLPVVALRPNPNPMSFNGKKASQSASKRAAGRFCRQWTIQASRFSPESASD